MTGTDGGFVFPDLLAGTFDLTRHHQGFKTYEQKGIVLGATERVALRAIALDVGGVTETVLYRPNRYRCRPRTARGPESSRARRWTTSPSRGAIRRPAQLLPGVIDTRNREAPGWESMNNLSINGRTSFNFSYDGVTNKDTGQNGGNFAAPALDSIAEIRVQTSNFQAEYGRSSGATITVVTRSGTGTFTAARPSTSVTMSGTATSTSAASCATQPAQCDPPLYTFDNTAWTLGGPVLIPKTSFNKGRNKLFFFWSQDLLGRTDPGGLNQRRVPTALERQGDFSQTLDNQNRLVFIRDPLLTGNCAATTGGPACFPGNVIPAGRIDANARALLNLFPLPNAADPTGTNQYNYVFQTEQDWPRNDQVLRMDWNVAQNTSMYGRLQFGYEKRSGGVSLLGSTGGWPQMADEVRDRYGQLREHAAAHVQPDAVRRVHRGRELGASVHEPVRRGGARGQRSAAGAAGHAAVLPGGESAGIIPQATFSGGVPGNPLQFGIEQRFPFFGYNTLFNISGNLTKVSGAHTMKAGLFVEHTTRPAARTSSFNGNFSFNTDAQNPLNTNIGFANALIGAIWDTPNRTAIRRRTASSSSPSGTRRTPGG